MKEFGGWWFPDHEVHLIDWLKKAGQKIDGRLAYQHKKWEAAISNCNSFRTAIDCGCHIGTWSFYLAKRFETVQAFEPVAEHRACFERNVTAKNVTLHPIALGATRDSVAMRVTPRSSGDSWVSGAGEVAMEPLDAFGFADVSLMKLDTEGFEENVLRGGIETIRRCRPVVCVEQKREMSLKFGLKKLGAVDLLQREGYRVAQELSGDFIMVSA